jgi:DNA ligase-associated metallophosphoesterase
MQIGETSFIADPSGALYWEAERLLVVADLHFEKGSAFAAKQVFLPPYDTAATLNRLAQLVSFFEPRRVVALGDSFHDAKAGERIASEDRARLRSLQGGRDWIWIAGNHDGDLPVDLAGELLPELSIGGVVFRHAPRAGSALGEIAGHLHPVAKVAGRAGRVRRRCFVSNGERCILPAFGAFAGGLNLHDEAFRLLFHAPSAVADVFAYVMGRDAVFKLHHRRCLPD